MFLDFPGAGIVRAGITGRRNRQDYRRFEPQVVYLPHRGDVHSDHRCVYNAALVAVRPVPGCPVGRVLSYETLSSTEWGSPSADAAFIPTCFVDISEYLDAKLEAMATISNELKSSTSALFGEPARPRRLPGINGWREGRGGVRGGARHRPLAGPALRSREDRHCNGMEGLGPQDAVPFAGERAGR